MLKIGKKVTFRPLLLSLVLGLLAFLLGKEASSSFGIGLGFGIALFLLIMLSYYLPNLPLYLSYFETDDKKFSYTNMNSTGHRLAMMFAPSVADKLTDVKWSEVNSVVVTGKGGKEQEVPFALIYTAYLGVISAAILMSRNPMYLHLTLKNGQDLDLSLTRDYVYDSKKAIGELNQILDICKENGVNVKNNIKFEVYDPKSSYQN